MAVISEYRVRSTAYRVKNAEQEIINDSKIACDCLEFQGVLADANQILVDLFEIDADLQDARYDGHSNDPLAERVIIVFGSWLALADKLTEIAVSFETRGYKVEGLVALRAGIVDVQGGYEPNCEVSDKFVQLRDKAVEEHRNGKSIRVPASSL